MLGWTTERFFAEPDQAEPHGFAGAFEQLVARRAAREPFAYIVGTQEFWGLAVEVTPAVLIPRPETELLVEGALAIVPAPQGAAIADVCTGSGCVAIAIARERPAVRVVATDVSAPALEVAERNAVRHGVAGRVDFRRVDLLDGIAATFDVIVANPPYVAERDRGGIQPEVKDHEPGIALFAGDDGLDVIKRLVPAARDRLRSGGTLLFEFGFGQDRAVTELLSATAGLALVELRPDLQGIPRVAVARRETAGR